MIRNLLLARHLHSAVLVNMRVRYWLHRTLEEFPLAGSKKGNSRVMHEISRKNRLNKIHVTDFRRLRGLPRLVG